MKIKKYFIYSFLIALSLIIILFFISKNEKKERNDIKIGAILPLTGGAADAGKFTKFGIDLAVEEINKNGGIIGDSLFVIYEDSKADPKTGVSGVTKLISQDKVNYIIDNSISAVTLAVAPIINSNNCVLISTGGSSPEITKAGKNIFRIWNSDYEEANAMARFSIDSLQLKNILIVYTNDEYGNGLKKSYISNADNKINIKEIAVNTNVDISLILLNDLKYYEAIYIIGHSASTIQIIKKVIQNGFNGCFLGTSVMLDPIIQKEFINLKQVLYYPVPKTQSSENSEFIKFSKLYMNKYKNNPVPLSDVGYDAVMLFYKAINKNKIDKYGSVINYFNKRENIIGASGNIQFDENGDVHKEITIIKFKNK